MVREQHRRLAHRRLKLLPAVREAREAKEAKEARVVKVAKDCSAPQPEHRRGRVRLTAHLPGHRRRKGNRLRPRQGWLPGRPGERRRPGDPRLQVLAAKAGRVARLPAALRRQDSAGRVARARRAGRAGILWVLQLQRRRVGRREGRPRPEDPVRFE